MNEGYMIACEVLYNLITLGKAFEQTFDGDKKKHYTLNTLTGRFRRTMFSCYRRIQCHPQ